MEVLSEQLLGRWWLGCCLVQRVEQRLESQLEQPWGWLSAQRLVVMSQLWEMSVAWWWATW
jgi:hypothetical protein